MGQSSDRIAELVAARVAFVAIGANLPSPGHATPRDACRAALEVLSARDGISLAAVSRWYMSPAFPPSEQPDYVNAVARIETVLEPEMLMMVLHGIELQFGRRRSVPNAARTMDLDLIDYSGMVRGASPVLPHARLHERLFVLLPLRDVAPDWRHPVSLRSIDRLIDLADQATAAEPV